MKSSIHLLSALTATLLVFPSFARAQDPANPERPATRGLRFEISFSPEMSATPLDGRVLLLISKSERGEPRQQIAPLSPTRTQQVFGVDVDGLVPGAAAVIDASDDEGYPLARLSDLPPGDYTVQGLINIFETFHLANGHTVKLPPDRGEGQRWNAKPGNLYSVPQRMHLDPQAGGLVSIVLTKKVPPVPPQAADTKYVKHIWIQSKLLSDFWGTPVQLGAVVLLPEGWGEHPEARYPLLLQVMHFQPDLVDPVEFRATPPTPDLKGDVRLKAEYSHKFYQDWTSGRLPHMLLMTVQHTNPYYNASYTANSANVGPYGDAIVKELIPEVERRFHGIGQGWARALYGGSTGGWEAMALQVFNPDSFNGAWVFSPDPIDFRAFMTSDIYKDKNVYWDEGEWSHVPRPAFRTPDEVVLATTESINRYELAIGGTHMRSGEYFAMWQAVYGPVGADGYPKALFDIRTGVVDPAVAAYWREHYDLRHIMERDWKTLGPKLVGKLHIKAGTRDTYYLDGAVRLTQKFLESTNNPYYAGDFEWGPHMPHGFFGDPHQSLPEYALVDGKPSWTDTMIDVISRLTVHQRIMPIFEKWIDKSAPPGADLTSWKY